MDSVNLSALFRLLLCSSLVALCLSVQLVAKTHWIFYPGFCDGPGEVINYCQQYSSASTGRIASMSIDMLSRCIPLLSPEPCVSLIDPGVVTVCHGAEVVLRPYDCIGQPQRLLNATLPSRCFLRGSGFVNALYDGSQEHEGVMLSYKAARKNYDLDLSRINIAQEDDKQQLNQVVRTVLAESNDCNIILMGFSRGAATIFTYLSDPSNHDVTERIAGVILIGCFDSLEGSQQPGGWSWFPHALLWRCMRPLLGYTVENAFVDRIEPIDVVDRFPKNIPVLFVTSKTDSRVFPASTKRLAHAVANKKQQPVFCLTLERARHSRYYKNDLRDAQLLCNTVHAFYQLCGVSYDVPEALYGQEALACAALYIPNN